MASVADVFRRHAPSYLERFGEQMPAEHKKVLRAIGACRTGALGTVFYRCSSCGHTHAMGRSCGNRHCPSCQQHLTKAWLQAQTARLLPCPYFLITFTLPEGLRRFVRSHQRVAYAALFDASSEALKKLVADPKFIGSRHCGFFGVLHTWGRTLEYHPHVHYVVPGGAVRSDGAQWLASRADFFVPVKALSVIFRAKFRDAIKREGLHPLIDPAVWRQDWVVHSQATGDGAASLRYLAPYVFRVAISDRRIVSFDDQNVTFSYRKTGGNRWRRMTLPAHEFIRRFLQHVLPAGFQKVRHYGFLSANSRWSIEAVRWLVTLHYGLTFSLLSLSKKSPQPVVGSFLCPQCGGTMRIVDYWPPIHIAAFDTS